MQTPGGQTQGGAILQRWGRNAKKGGAKTQMSFYSKTNLMKVANARGYMSMKTLADALVKTFGVSSATIQNKFRYGTLTLAECEVVGSYLEMSMKEYYDVFMNGLFRVDQQGHYVCHVDNPYLHLHPSVAAVTVSEEIINNKLRQKDTTIKTAKEVLEELKDF